MTPRRARRVVGSLALALALAGASARANPMDMYGLGSRGVGMAGGVSADASDVGANYYNAAGLARASGLRFELGYFYAHHALRTNGRDNAVDPARGVVVGLVAPARLFRLPFAFGLVLHLPDDRIARSRLLPEAQPRWELYDNRVQRLYFAANVAVAPRPWLRIGGGFSYLASTRGTLGLRGEIPVTRANDAALTHTVDVDVRAVFYPQVGVQVDPHPTLTLSAVYRGEFRFRLDLDADLGLDLVVGNPRDPMAIRAATRIALEASAITAFLPQQVVLGAAWRPRPWITLAGDVTYVDWAAYESPAPAITPSVAFDMPPGSEDIPRPVVPPPSRPRPARFASTLVPRVGLEWRAPLGAHALAARAGYRYDASPVPDQTGPTNFLDSTRHAVALGAGVTFRAPTARSATVTLDLHAELQHLERRTVRKDDPADPVGDYVLDGNVLNLGVTLATSF